ncbi:MAG: hypothetical protein KBA30_08180 [Clostridia bacterium]|nr:hypothetical protein [Clostridia bacterium]
MRPVVDKRKCSAQPQICPPMKACPVQAIRYVEDEDEPIGGRIEIDYGLCDGCGKCVPLCCGECIGRVDP